MEKLKKAAFYLIVFCCGALSAILIILLLQNSTQNKSESTVSIASAQSLTEQKATEIKELIDTCFIGEYSEEEMADAVADAMVTATGDRWSYYISADSYSTYVEQMTNSYVGIGVTITQSDDIITVVNVTENGPADQAGFLAGDIILAVDGESVSGMTTTEVRNLVRGEEGTAVLLTVQREESQFDISVVRAAIQNVVASYRLLNDTVGYIIIENFDEHCADSVIECIETAIADGADSLLFDVRFNPGGYKAELVEILDYLLPEGPLFTMTDYAGRTNTDYSDASCVDMPIAVLINDSSYSAAEFFAAAIQEYQAGVIVGDQTCGKGYFQYTYNLSDGSAVALSSGTYYTPNGISLIGTGVIPDYSVSLTEEAYYLLYADQLDISDDTQLQAALSLLNAK